MEEIKVGEYVITNKGLIRKVKTIYGEEDGKQRTFYHEKQVLINGNINILDIVKHSPNIIDLIEKDDYVNGEKVINIDRVDSEYGIVKCSNGNHYWNYEIKTILTKEQYKENCYEVK